jgi:cytochrome c-type biogenesis protein CcmF
VELGHFALILALGVALIQSTVPVIGAARDRISLMEVSRTAALGQFLLVALAFGCLMHAYIVSDFSVLNVAMNSHSLKPMLYKISGTWGNHEGSMLLWVLILAGFGAAVAVFGGKLPPALRARALGVQSSFRLPSTAEGLTPCFRTRVSRFIRRFSTSATLASRWRSRLPSPP